MTFEIGAILVVGAAVLFILQPLVTGRGASLVRAADEPTEAEANRRVKLLALRDVESDYQTGKLDEADYRALKKELSQEALHALAEVEAEHDADDGGEPTTAAGEALDPELEAAVARVREGLRSGRTCTGCGHVNPAGSRFCSSCGGTLGAEATAG